MRYLDDEMLAISVYEYEQLRDQASMAEHWQKRHAQMKDRLGYALYALAVLACAIVGFALAYWSGA